MDRIYRHIEQRLIETAMALYFLGEGILLIYSPGSVQAGAFRFMLQIVDVPTITIVYLVIGVSRIIALGLNGHWMPYGAYTRAVGAAIGALMLAQMDAALVTYSTHGNTLPFGTPLFGVLALFEAISMYRALLGAKAHGAVLGLGDSNGDAVASGPGAIFDRNHIRRAGNHTPRPEGVEILRGGRSISHARTG
jgi:hypothetical protein